MIDLLVFHSIIVSLQAHEEEYFRIINRLKSTE